jgi:hypothetical protein
LIATIDPRAATHRRSVRDFLLVWNSEVLGRESVSLSLENAPVPPPTLLPRVPLACTPPLIVAAGAVAPGVAAGLQCRRPQALGFEF